MARIYNLAPGVNLPDELVKIATTEKIATARVEAIGGVRHLELSYFNHQAKKYEEHRYEEFLEVTGIVGNITLKDGKPFLHAHGTFARRDLSVIGGHIMSATVFPLLEVVITPTENTAIREFDEETGLNLIQRTQG